MLHTLDSTVQCVLVSPVFGTVSSLHPTSFLYLLNYFFLHCPGQYSNCLPKVMNALLESIYLYVMCVCDLYVACMHLCVGRPPGANLALTTMHELHTEVCTTAVLR